MKPSHPVFEELEALAVQGGWVEGLARRLVADTHLAEDLVQEAWLVALQNGERARGPLSAWIAGVIKRVSRDRRRSDLRRSFREAHVARAEGVEPAADGAEQLEQQALLIQNILSLSDPYRSVILMRYIEERTPRQIAEQLTLPISTVNSRLTRGLEQLRAKLVEAHGGDETRWLGSMLLLSKVSARDGMAMLGVALMKSKLTLIACLFLIVAGVFWTLPPGVSPDPELQADLAESTLVPPLDERPVEGEGQPVTTNQAAPPGRVALAMPETTNAADLGSLRILDGATGLPAPGATLHVVDLLQIMQDPRAAIALNRRSPLYELGREYEIAGEFGVAYLADANGIAHFPSPAPQTTYYATLGDKAGLFRSMESAPTASDGLMLWPHGNIHVIVRDELGSPLPKVPLVVINDGGDFPLALARALTDQDGRAQFHPLAMLDSTLGEGVPGRVRIQLDTPLAVARAETVQMAAGERHDVELIMPAHASLQVEVFLRGSDPLPDGSAVLLRATAGEHYLPLTLSTGVRLERTQSGRADFDYLAPGLELELVVPLEGRRDHWTTRFNGPSRVGEVFSKQVVIGADQHLYHGTLFAANGMPYSEATFAVVYDSGNGSGHLWQQTCDDDGRFEFELLGLDHRAPVGELTLRPTYDNADESRVEVQLSLEQHDLGTDHGLGSLQFDPEPMPSIAGVVVDPTGQPVEGAFVSWFTEQADHPRVTGQARHNAVQRTDEQGRFVFHERFPRPGVVFLAVDPIGSWQMENVRIPGETMDLVLQLTSSASISGNVLTNIRLESHGLSVRLWDLSRGPAPARHARGWLGRSVLRDGTFELNGLQAGPHAFVLETTKGSLPLLQLEQVEVRQDGVSDERLQNIDLRDKLRLIRVELRDARQGLVVSSHTWFVPDEGARYELGSEPELLLVGDPQGCLVCVAPGGLPALARLTSANEYFLREPPGVDVELRWAGESPLESYSWNFNVWLDLDDDLAGDPATLRARRMQLSIASCGGRFVPGRPLRIKLPGPGQYRTLWSAAGHPEGHRKTAWSGTVSLEDGQTVLEMAPPESWAADGE